MILEVQNITKHFGGLAALSEVCFTVSEGEILGLIGPNGSGKTTLFNLITGFLKPDTGRITFRGRDITGCSPFELCRIGIARTFQLNKPFATMTVLENVMAGRLYGARRAHGLKQAKSEAEELLELMSLEKKAKKPAFTLGVVERKRMEMARALATRPALLCLDEMMAGLNLKEIEEAMGLLKRLKDWGITLVVVEHVMKAILGISDRVVVLNAGRKIAEGTPREIIINEQVIQAYLGEEHDP